VPTVPRIQRQVSPAALPNARRSAHLTPLAAGVGLAQAQGNIGAALESAGISVGIATARLEAARVEAAERARKEANRVAAMRLKNRADTWQREHVYKPGTGYLSQQGEGALFLPEQAQHDLREFMTEIAPTLTNPDQHLAWEEIGAELSDSTMLAVYRHTEGERDKTMVAEYTARLNNARSLAGSSIQDPATYVKHVRNGFEAIDETAAFLRWPKAVHEEAKRAFASDVNVLGIHNLVAAGEVDKAESMLAAAKAQGVIAGEQLREVTGTVEAGSALKQATAEFDRLDKSGMTPTEQRADVQRNDKLSAKVRELTLGMIEHEVTADRNMAGADREAVNAEITAILMKKGAQASLADIPAKRLKDIKSPELQQWLSVIDNLRGTAAAPPSPHPKVSKPSVLAYLYDLAQRDPTLFTAYPDKDGKNGLDLTTANYIGSLSQADWEYFVKLQTTMRAGKREEADKIASGPFTFQTIWNQHLGIAKIKKDDPKALEIRAQVEQDGRWEAALKGKPLGGDDWDKIIRRNMQSHTFSAPWLWSNDVRRGYQFTFDDIPVGMRNELKEAIESVPGQPKVGNMATDERMVSVYRRYFFSLPEAQRNTPEHKGAK